MFNLIRRISSSVIPRPDRPWEDDATSNAPHVGKKRRMTDDDRDDDDEQARQKRARAIAPDAAEDEARGSSAAPQSQAPDTPDVKEVTKGVKEVELEDKPAPESVPLPDEEETGELEPELDSKAEEEASPRSAARPETAAAEGESVPQDDPKLETTAPEDVAQTAVVDIATEELEHPAGDAPSTNGLIETEANDETTIAEAESTIAQKPTAVTTSDDDE